VAAEPGFGIRRTLAALGIAAGLFHFVMQGKGWEYHLYPLALFLCALAAPAFAARTRLARAAAVVLFAATTLVLGAKGVQAMDAPWIDDKARRVAALASELAPRVPPGATVQVMDTTEG